MPDYAIRLEDMMVVFVNRQGGALGEGATPGEGPPIRLGATTYDAARQAAPGWDIYVLEAEWRAWMSDGGLDAPRDPDKAFLGFCRKWFEKRGRP